MPKNNSSINNSLFDLLKGKGYSPTMLSTAGKEIPTPDEAEVFQFNFVKDGEDYGKVTLTIDDSSNLIVYYSDDVADSEKETTSGSGDLSWYGLLNQLKRFAQRYQLSFELRNTDNLKSDMAKRDYMKKQDQIAESRRCVSEMNNRTLSGDRKEQRANSPEAIAQREKEQQAELKKVSPEMRKKLRLPNPDKEDMAEGSLNEGQYEMMLRNGQVKKFIAKDDADAKRIAAGHNAKSVIRLRGGVPAGKVLEQDVAEGQTGASVKKWAEQVRQEHGADTKFWNDKVHDRIIARKDKEIVGSYDRKANNGTVFSPEQGVAEGLNEFAQGDFNGDNDNNDLQLYLNVAKKLDMKKYKPSTAHDLIAKKMSELVDAVDDEKVDWARHMARKAQGLPSVLDQQGVAEGTDDSTQVLSDIVANEDFDALYDLMSSDTEAGKIVQRMYNDVSGEEGLHPDDDFEKILSIVLDHLTQDYGQQGVAEANGGHAGSAKVRYTGGMHGEYDPTKKQASPQAHLDAAKYHNDEANKYIAAMNHPKSDQKNKEWYKNKIQHHKNKADFHIQASGQQGVVEGYSLKKTSVSKHMEPGDPEEYTQDVNIKDTDYEIINNKTGQVVGTASQTTNDFMGSGALKITMKNGATRWLDIWDSEKGNPQTAFNRFVKDPKTASKYKGQDMKGVTEMDKSQTPSGRDGHISHSTYGSRDKGGSTGAERTAKPVTAKQATTNAMAILNKQSKKKDMAEGRVDQIAPGGADYSKHSTDELKAMLRPGVMGRNELKFKTLIRQELRKREQQGVAEAKGDEYYDLTAEHVPAKAIPLIKKELAQAGITLKWVKPRKYFEYETIFEIVTNEKGLKVAKNIIWKYNKGNYVGIMNEQDMAEGQETMKNEQDLDEMDRRGFLKGLGATAVAGAAGITTKDAKAHNLGDLEIGIVQNMLELYHFCKINIENSVVKTNILKFSNGAELLPIWTTVTTKLCPIINSSIKKFSNANFRLDGRLVTGKEVLSSFWPKEKEKLDNELENDIKAGGVLLMYVIQQSKKIIDKFNSLTEFNESNQQVSEGYYPMGKQGSYSDAVPTTKIIIQHSRKIEEGEQRYRNIAKIFVENTQGERFAVPTNKPGLARVYARHIAEGGTPYDERGRHITSLVEEYSKMSGFMRATKGKQFNESAQQLVTEAVNYYQSLRESLSKMTGHRGYSAYFESWTPALMEDGEEQETNLNELFVQETLDPRIESVMPILGKLQRKLGNIKQVDELAEWADNIIEGDGGQEALNSQGIPEAAGAETLAHNIRTDRSNLKAFDLEETTDVTDDNPKSQGGTRAELLRKYANTKRSTDAEAARRAGASQSELKAAADSTEEIHEGASSQDLQNAILYRVEMRHPDLVSKYGHEYVADKALDVASFHTDAEEIGGSDKTAMVNHLVDTLKREGENGLDENLDANQIRAGQLGPTEKVGPQGAVGKLVGAEESVNESEDELARILQMVKHKR
jgi:hypothetical protein